MGYKKLHEGLGLADFVISKVLKRSWSYKRLEKFNSVVNCRRIEALLLEYYDVGKSKEGADAYSPLMLLKCLLLQKWFRIPSDSKLEDQINDRISS